MYICVFLFLGWSASFARAMAYIRGTYYGIILRAFYGIILQNYVKGSFAGFDYGILVMDYITEVY